MKQDDANIPDDFQGFFKSSYPRIIAIAYMLCRNRADAEDAVQEAYTEALVRWAELGQFDAPDAWVLKVMKQRLQLPWRRLSRVEPVGLDVEGPIAGAVEQAVQARLVLDALAALPPRQRQVIVMHCLDGMSQDEIARGIGRSRGAVAASIHKGREKMKEKLGIVSGSLDALVAFEQTDSFAEASSHDPLSIALRVAQAWLQKVAEKDRHAIASIYSKVTARRGR